MPGMYAKGDYDLAGFSVGAAERGTLLPRTERDGQAGDVIVGIASSGPHSNGYSLVRKVVERSGLAWDAPAPFAAGQTLAEALLTPTRHLRQSAEADLRRQARQGRRPTSPAAAWSKTRRALCPIISKRISIGTPGRAPAVFEWLQATGGVPEADMRRTFNLGDRHGA